MAWEGLIFFSISHAVLLHFTFMKTYFGACRLSLHSSAPSQRAINSWQNIIEQETAPHQLNFCWFKNNWRHWCK